MLAPAHRVLQSTPVLRLVNACQIDAKRITMKAYLFLSSSHSLPDQTLVSDHARKKPVTAERNQAV